MPVDIRHLHHTPIDHVVQFYRHDEELVEAASAYLAEGMRVGEAAIVIATPAHVHAFEAGLAKLGIDPAVARAEGRLVICDAQDTLASFLVDERPDPGRFDAVVGELCRATAATGRPIRGYGEMVAILWDAGQVHAAIELEELWNELRQRVAFSLYCAYPSASVAAASHPDGFGQIRRCHSEVVDRSAFGASAAASGNHNGLGMANRQDRPTAPQVAPSASAQDGGLFSRSFACTPESATAARHFVTALVEDRRLVDDAALVVTELATNAVRHARSTFNVTVVAGGGGLRISVSDGAAELPSPGESSVLSSGGRGLYMVASIADRWGVEPRAHGKTVWAELRALPASA